VWWHVLTPDCISPQMFTLRNGKSWALSPHLMNCYVWLGKTNLNSGELEQYLQLYTVYNQFVLFCPLMWYGLLMSPPPPPCKQVWKTLQIFQNLKFGQMSKKINKFNFPSFIQHFFYSVSIGEIAFLKLLTTTRSFP